MLRVEGGQDYDALCNALLMCEWICVMCTRLTFFIYWVDRDSIVYIRIFSYIQEWVAVGIRGSAVNYD